MPRIKNLLQMNPKERYTAEQALNDAPCAVHWVFQFNAGTVAEPFTGSRPEVWIKEKAPKAKDVNLQAGKLGSGSWQSCLVLCRPN